VSVEAGGSEAGAVGKLSTLDRCLPVWILAAMALGLLAGRPDEDGHGILMAPPGRVSAPEEYGRARDTAPPAPGHRAGLSGWSGAWSVSWP
jgi:hypothetical protein